MKKNKILFITIASILILLFITSLCFDADTIQVELFFAGFNDYIADFVNNLKNVSYNNPYYINMVDNFPEEHVYPPIAYLLFKIIYNIILNMSTQASFIFVCHFSIMFLSFILMLILYNGIKTGNVFKNLLIFIFMFSGIFLYSYERGNISILCAAFNAFFIFNYNSENKLIKELSLVTIAFAVALKITPVLLIVLLLYKKEYKAIIRTIIYSLILFFLPFMFFKGGFSAIPVLLHNMQLNVQNYHWRGIPNFFILDNYPNIQNLLKLCFAQIATFVSMLAVISNFTFESEWKKVAQLILIIQNINPSSAIYVMLNFFVFIVLFFNKKEEDKNDIFYVIMMIIMLNPYQIGYRMSFDFIFITQLFLLVILTQESLKNLFSILKKNIAKLKLQETQSEE